MIRRTIEPDFLNSVANHPEVHKWSGVTELVDVGPLLNDLANVALETEGGGFVLVALEPSYYEVHSIFLPDGRRNTVRAMRDGLDYMFTRTDAEKIVTQVPDNNPAAAALTKLAHFRPMFRREETPRGPTAYAGITIDEWAIGTSALEKDGEWFHEVTAEAVKAARPEIPDHPHDLAHIRTVGAAVRMIRAGNTEKGVAFYNRWARFAGYTPITLLSDAPVVLDMSEAGLSFIVEVKDGAMEILRCR